MDDEFDDVDEHLREEERREKQRVKSMLEDVEKALSERGDVYDEVLKELNGEIQVQSNRLSRASKGEEPRIRGVLQELYRERRREKIDFWRDRESWVERKLELERELDELESIEELDLED